MAKVKAPRQVVAERKEIQHQIEDLQFHPAERIAHYWEDNRKRISLILLGLFAVGALIGGYMWYQNIQNHEANQKLTAALQLLNSNQPQQALDGMGKTTGLRKIAQTYSGTDAGNVAQLHVASALLALNKKAEAYKFLDQYDKGEDALGANAYASMASIKADEKNYKMAVELYQKAAEAYPNENTSPQFLLQAAQTAAKIPDTKLAKSLVDALKSQYATSAVAKNIDFELAQMGL